jgi:CheY-like chemotaxis protein
MRHRILCVDDEEIIRDALILFLEHLGLEVRCFATGRECLEEFQTAHDQYDLVMVNYDMPGMGGAEVIGKLLEIDRTKRISITSGYAEDDIYRVVKRESLAEFLPKPYTLSKLRRFLQRNLPVVEPQVIAVAAAGRAERPWARLLRVHGGESGAGIPVTFTDDPAVALTAAMKGFSKVIFWELDSGLPRQPIIEKARSEAIPIVFIGKDARIPGAERSWPVLPSDAGIEALVAAIHGAVRGKTARLQN